MGVVPAGEHEGETGNGVIQMKNNIRISYDEQSRGLFISFGDPSHYRVSKEVAGGVVVDFDENGKALAVEIEDVSAVIEPSDVYSYPLHKR